MHPKHTAEQLDRLAGEYDLKYVQIDTFEELCSEIHAASQMGKVQAVIIDAHGFPWAIHLSGNTYLTVFDDYQSCFNSLDPSAPIVLMSCSTAAGSESIAKFIADNGLRSVTAPTIPISGKEIRIEQVLPLKARFISSGKDVTKIFHPSTIPLGPVLIPNLIASNQYLGTILIDASMTNRLDLVNRLLDGKMISDEDQGIAFLEAVRCGYLDIMKALLKKGSIPLIARSQAIESCAKDGHLEMVGTLLANGSVSDRDRGYAIGCAAQGGHLEMVRTLLANGSISDRDRGVTIDRTLLCRHPLSDNMLAAALSY